MKRWLATALMLHLTGCSIGGGSAFVGQWRAHDRVDFEACLEDQTGRCLDRKQVVTHVPERAYWGFILPYPEVGAALVTEDGETSVRARFEPSFELLRGTGRAAWGVRASVLYDSNGAFSVPAIALGHYSLTERMSIHGGAGISPFSQLNGERSFFGARGLLGMQLALSRAHSENHVVLSLEADTLWVNFERPYRSTALAGHIGVFF